MHKACEHCGADNPGLARFCRQCGKPWAEAWLRSVTPVTPLLRQWRRLKRQMTRKEVRGLLGEPARIESAASGSPGSEQWTYVYECGPNPPGPLRGRVEFELPDGTVRAWTEPDWQGSCS